MMDHYDQMHHEFAGHWIGMVLLLIGLAAVAFGLVRLYGRTNAPSCSCGGNCCSTEPKDNEAVRILQLRLANGSIGTDEYEATLKVLRS
jgi:uncharacterized membrane protein